MTDNEIIKALECISGKENVLCKNCSYNKYHLMECHRTASKDALDLINRQQAEIERLGKRLEAVQGAKCVYSYDGETLEYCTASPCPIYKTAEQIKSEAIKEFAERLKESKFDVDVSFGYGREVYTEAVAVVEIDNLVKEMVGED